MSTPLVLRYPLDTTGTNPNNLVAGELRTMPRKKVRPLAPLYGAFYSESMRVIDTTTNLELVKGTQYHSIELYELPSAKYGKEICGLILIIDPAVSDQVSLQYQAVGGEYSTPATAIEQLIDNLSRDDRPIGWPSIINLPSEFPVSNHFHDVGDVYGFEYVVHAIDRVRRAIELGDDVAHDTIYRYIDSVVGQVTPETIDALYAAIDAAKVDAHNALQAHIDASDPHPQYLRKDDTTITPTYELVRKPTNVSPANAATGIGPSSITLTASAYASLYGLTQQSAEFHMSKAADCSAPYVLVSTQGATNTMTYNIMLESGVTYYWQVRYQDAEGNWSDWSTPTSFIASAYSIATPSITSPANGASVATMSVPMTGSAFTVTGISDSHVSSDWEVWSAPNGAGTLLWSSYNDTVNKTSITVPANVLANKSTYYPRVRYKGNTLGYSSWSSSTASFYLDYPLWPTNIGQFFEGGYYAGDIGINGTTYGIFVANKATEVIGQLTADTSNYNANSRTDSVYDTAQLAMSSSGVAKTLQSLSLNGYDDWVLPAIEVLKVVLQNLNPAGVNTPAIFKAGGSQAFAANQYWSSTEYVNVVTTSGGGDPIYGNVTHTQQNNSVFMGWADIVGETPAVSCSQGTASNVSYGYFFALDSSRNVYDDQVYATYTCTWTSYEVTGYTDTWTSTDYYYEALSSNFGSTSANETNCSKQTQLYGRAVRLVAKPAGA